MSPGGLVSLTLGITLGGIIAEKVARHSRHRQLAALAVELKLNFSPSDQLKLAARVARFFPIPGAAHLVVHDVIYGIAGERYRYVFTASYTIGVLRTKHRRTCVAAFSELRERKPTDLVETLELGSADAPLLEQYRQLASQNAGPEPIGIVKSMTP